MNFDQRKNAIINEIQTTFIEEGSQKIGPNIFYKTGKKLVFFSNIINSGFIFYI